MKYFITIIICSLCATGVGQNTDSSTKTNMSYAYVPTEDATYAYKKYNKKLYGPVKKYKDDKLVEEGWMVNNKRHSDWKQYNTQGKKTAEVQFTQGKRHGVWRIWDDNGVLRYRYEYHKGKPTGNWAMYNAQGDVVQTRHHD